MSSTSRARRCPGSRWCVTHQSSGQFRQVVSNADGSYFLTNLIPGPYKITADLTGFKKYERPDVVLQIGSTATLDITLGGRRPRGERDGVGDLAAG